MNMMWYLAIVCTVVILMALLLWLQTRSLSKGFGAFIARIINHLGKKKGE